MKFNNFVINRVRRGTMFSKTDGSVLWSVNQIEEPSLSMTSEQGEKVDALGALIASFDRAKSGEFTANNSLLDMGLLAAQGGREVEQAATGATVTMPLWEEITLTAQDVTNAYVTLKQTPTGTSGAEIPFIYKLSGDGTLDVKYTIGEAASASAFKLDPAEKKLTFPTGLAAGDRLWVPYEYAAASGLHVANDGVNFPKAGKFVMEVLIGDVCDTTQEYYAYLVFNNAKLTSDFDITFNTEGTHPFTIRLMQDYCDAEKRLFDVYVPDLTESA